MCLIVWSVVNRRGRVEPQARLYVFRAVVLKSNARVDFVLRYRIHPSGTQEENASQNLSLFEGVEVSVE